MSARLLKRLEELRDKPLGTVADLGKLARQAGLKRGDRIISMGGYPYTDVLDYYFFDGEDEPFEITVERNGKIKNFTVKKPPTSTLDLSFDDEISPIECKNNCVFCFVRQLPEGMRDTMYVKDDDYRLSVISGTYITLTNLSDAEKERIIRLKLSPLYISVHAYSPEVRLKMLKNPSTLKLFSIMKEFAAAGIEMHTQVVVCPGINDGTVLNETIAELHKLYPSVKSAAVVPVGLTKHRCGLPELTPVTREQARQTVADTEKFNHEFGGFVWCADEYYLKAELPLPDYGYYEDFSQIENGVGLIADFRDKFFENLQEAASGGTGLTNVTGGVNSKKAFASVPKRVLLITGVSFAEELRVVAKKIEQAFPEAFKCSVLPVLNDFFGTTVTVAGLVTGGDIIAQAAGINADFAMIPANMLREFGDVFLDGVSVDELSAALKMPVYIGAADGNDFLKVLLSAADTDTK
ncbi:MAG: DUF512 domain-containing protein [Clostridiaceae bacterium]|jgi:putative radical SAM enzyme (TIGR03279 family)|nr:DUF512 domain-containing protein [Clostridiaceae bacterium]